MPDPLPPETARTVARLARLDLSEAELGHTRLHLASVLAYMDRLHELDLTNVEPLFNPIDAVNRLDDDTPGPTLPTATLMAMAPDTLPPFIKVPKVLGDAGGA